MLCFVFLSPEELVRALGESCSQEEAFEINRLCEAGLPPVTSLPTLSVMLGYNPGFVWSLLTRIPKYYREFAIPKGQGTRIINAPRVSLKIIQRWLGVHFEKAWQPIGNVYGFVRGRSHIDAAARHLGAEWVYSIDIENFFPSIGSARVNDALGALGYSNDLGKQIIQDLCCLEERLTQGAPTSPVLSNIVLDSLDRKLVELAHGQGINYTRYADDMVFSGQGEPDKAILGNFYNAVEEDGWTISERKVHLAQAPHRLKVHGLLVHGDRVRLTKGYRNRLRAFKHLVDAGRTMPEDDKAKMRGHLAYAAYIEGKGG